MESSKNSSLKCMLEAVSNDGGIIGWAIDLDVPTKPVTLALSVGDQLVATVETNRSRGDVCSVFELPDDGDVFPGFQFGPEVFYDISGLPDMSPDDPVIVSVQGTGIVLESTSTLLTVGDCIELADASSELFGLTNQVSQFADLSTGLDQLAREAQVLTSLAGERKRRAGILESITRLEGGLYFVTGWFESSTLVEFPAVILGQKSWPAAMALCTFEREDLGAGALAFLGVIRTDWLPKQQSEDIMVGYRENGKFLVLERLAERRNYLRSEIEQLINDAEPKTDAPERLSEIRTLVGQDSDWKVTTSGTNWLEIDRAVLLPGFGLFLNGWFLSAGQHRITSLQVRGGESVARLDRSTLYNHSRLDLQTAFPEVKDEALDAGFVTVLRGDIKPESISALLVRAEFSDSKAMVKPIDVSKVKVLRTEQGLKSLAEYYPRLDVESFAPGVKRAAVRALRSRLQCLAVKGCTADRAVVVHLSQDPSDLQVTLSSLYASIKDWPDDVSLILMADSRAPRKTVQSWLGDINRKAKTEVGHFRLIGEHGPLQLGTLLRQTDTKTFGYVKTGAVMKPKMWAKLANRVAGAAPAPVIYGTAHAQTGNPREDQLGALVWNDEGLYDWIRANRLRFDQAYLADLASQDGCEIVDDACYVIPRLPQSLFLTRLDANLQE